MVTDQQIRLYQKRRSKGFTQEAAAAAAGISPNTARKWEDLPLPSQSVQSARAWRTRPDPLAPVWTEEIVPLLEKDMDGALQATTLLDLVQTKHPGQYPDGLVRTLQRRLRDWRAQYGPGREVMFEQDYPPGRYSQTDFTRGEKLQVTIRGKAFAHLIFELRLCYSRWRHVELAFGETYEALTFCIQEAFFALQAAPHELQTDCLSAATQELKDELRCFTKRYAAFLKYYEVHPRRIKPGESQQNGGVERDHRTLKNVIDQALRLRDSRDFESVEAYWAFVVALVAKLNAKCEAALAEERPYLKALPSSRIPCYTDTPTTVRSTSCIQVRRNTYSVQSRLIGHKIVARVHPNTVELLYNGRVVDTYPRVRGSGNHRIDYRHVVHSLVNKPGGFAHYRYREELFPTLNFRRTYDALGEWRGHQADLEYLRILSLAATTLETAVDGALTELLQAGHPFDSVAVQKLVQPSITPAKVTEMRPLKPDLKGYDECIRPEEAVA